MVSRRLPLVREAYGRWRPRRVSVASLCRDGVVSSVSPLGVYRGRAVPGNPFYNGPTPPPSDNKFSRRYRRRSDGRLVPLPLGSGLR